MTTADGHTFDQCGFTAAHKALAFGTVARVTNTDTGRSVKVSINDRAPQVKHRIIDLSYAAARALPSEPPDNGATVTELEAIFGWQGGGMAALYTRAADRKRASLRA